MVTIQYNATADTEFQVCILQMQISAFLERERGNSSENVDVGAYKVFVL